MLVTHLSKVFTHLDGKSTKNYEFQYVIMSFSTQFM